MIGMMNFRKFSVFLMILSAGVLAGCAAPSPPAGSVIQVQAPDTAVLERQEVGVPIPKEGPPPGGYAVGPGDYLVVETYGLPQMAKSDQKNAENRTGSPSGSSGAFDSRVDGTGSIYLPWIGGVHVAGLTVAEIQDKLKGAFGNYVKNPWVVVQIGDYKSQPLYLLGEFNKPGTYYLDRPLNLLEGLAQGSGFKDTSDIHGARLIRGNKIYPVDISRLLEQGDPEQNVWLKPGDLIFVPDNKNKNVFVFGAVKKPGIVPMPHGQLTLGQALSMAGLQPVNADLEKVRIIRSLSATRGELLVVDLDKILRGHSIPYPLREGDIVFVGNSRVGNWNEAINELLPSLQLVSGVLQPFVQLKFLEQ
jgi:polysaccharide biosynthesis/export protein